MIRGNKGEQVIGIIAPGVGSQQYEGGADLDGSEQYEGMYPKSWEETQMEGYGQTIPRLEQQPGIEYQYQKTPRYAIPRPVTPTIIDAVTNEKLRQARNVEGMALRPTLDGQIVKPEPFAITSFTGAAGAITLVVNVANARTLVGTYTIPTGYRFVFDPDDPYQEVLFTPFTTSGVLDANFIVGDFEVTLEGATGGDVRRIFHSDTLHMRPASNISAVGHLRKWQHKYVGVPGDLVRFYFTSATVFSTTNSVLVARLRAGKVVL